MSRDGGRSLRSNLQSTSLLMTAADSHGGLGPRFTCAAVLNTHLKISMLLNFRRDECNKAVNLILILWKVQRNPDFI